MFMLASLVCCDVPIISIKTGRGRKKVERVISSFLVSLRRNFGRVAIDIFILSLRVSGDQPDLETHKGSYKIQQLRTKWDY